MSKTYEQWVEDEDPYFGEESTRDAWDYQQQRIEELEALVDRARHIIANYDEWDDVLPNECIDRLREALGGSDACRHVFRNVTGKPWRKCMECGVVIDDS